MNAENTSKPPETTQVKAEQVEPEINLGASPGMGQLFEALLKAPRSLLKHMQADRSAVLPLAFISLISLLLFGTLIGSFSGGWQILIAPGKIIAGLLVAALICFPSLYIFTALSGASLTPVFVSRGLITAIALISILLIGFSPVVWVFTQSSESLSFIGGIVIITWLISFFFGMGILKKMLRLGAAMGNGHLSIWISIFLLVTLQMSTSLRPLIGTSDTLLPSEKRFFLSHWAITLEDEENKASGERRNSRD